MYGHRVAYQQKLGIDSFSFDWLLSRIDDILTALPKHMHVHVRQPWNIQHEDSDTHNIEVKRKVVSIRHCNGKHATLSNIRQRGEKRKPFTRRSDRVQRDEGSVSDESCPVRGHGLSRREGKVKVSGNFCKRPGEHHSGELKLCAHGFDRVSDAPDQHKARGDLQGGCSGWSTDQPCERVQDFEDRAGLKHL